MLNQNMKKNILFLHGWGAQKTLMKTAFGAYFKDYAHIYLDLPGFGNSSNELSLTTHDYAAIVRAFLQDLGANVFIAVGHSFGGKVALLLDPPVLVLLSSAGILEKKPLAVRAKIAIFKLLKPFGARKIRNLFASRDAKNMSQNMYETFKNVVNEDFSAKFAARGAGQQTLIFWGKDDSATHLASGEKIHALIDGSKFFALEGDHFFFLDKGAQIERLALENLTSKRGG